MHHSFDHPNESLVSALYQIHVKGFETNFSTNDTVRAVPSFNLPMAEFCSSVRQDLLDGISMCYVVQINVKSCSDCVKVVQI